MIDSDKTINIAALMAENGILQEKMAEILGVSQSSVSLLKTGRSSLTPQRIEALQNALGVELCSKYIIDKVPLPPRRSVKKAIVAAEGCVTPPPASISVDILKKDLAHRDAIIAQKDELLAAQKLTIDILMSQLDILRKELDELKGK